MIVCLCNGASESDIRLAMHEGVRTFCEMIERGIAGTGCGGCHEQLLELLKVQNKPEEFSNDQDCDLVTK